VSILLCGVIRRTVACLEGGEIICLLDGGLVRVTRSLYLWSNVFVVRGAFYGANLFAL